MSVVGSNVPECMSNMFSEDVVFYNHVSDSELVELYLRSSVCIIPLRFGAGVKGKTLEAFQILLRNLISTYRKDHIITTLDIGGYRSNRAHQLEILATKTAKEVAKTKIAVKLQPMNSFERRVIHEKLSDWRDIYTESEGEGESRAIVIKPKNKENN